MLQKENLKKLLFMAALLMIIPLALSAAGAQEAGNNKAITLDENVMDLLDRLEAGDLTRDEARAEFEDLEKSYRVSAQERNQINLMIDSVARGDLKAEDCEEPLKDQLQTRDKIQDQDKIQDKTQASDGSGSVSGSGKK